MDIRKLIDNFMDGTSTLDEERLLGEYFRNEKDIPDELKSYREMFAYFDKGMSVGEGMLGCEDIFSDEMSPDRKRDNMRPASVVVLHRILSVAAAVAVLLVVAYNTIGGGDETPAVGKPECHLTAQNVSQDSLPSQVVDTTASRNARHDTEPVIRQQRKYRYKPAPPEVFTADANSYVMTDSVDMAGSRMAEAELRKVELEQQYMMNIIKTANLLNAADIAAAADEEVY